MLWLALPTGAKAQYVYTTNFPNTNTITITGYTGPGGDVAIPSSIAGKTVTAIGDWAFNTCLSLTRVAIPDSVVDVGEHAFVNCFALTNAVIGAGVATVGSWAFSSCFDLADITVNATNSVYSSTNGVLFDRNKTILLLCPQGKTGSYSIPVGVANIGAEAFYDCRLNTVTIPDSVTNIESRAFEGCDLTSVAIPDSVVNIEQSAFLLCSSLTNAAIGNGVTHIGDFMFQSCANLAHVTIGDGVAGFGAMAFDLCYNLTEFTVSAGNPIYSSEAGVVFDLNKTTLVLCPEGKTGSYSIPAGVVSIGDLAFYGCRLNTVTIPDSVANIEEMAFGNGNLSNITIGTGVTNIEYSAFASCIFLTGAYFYGKAPSVGEAAFNNSTNATIYHLTDATGWPPVPEPWAGRPTALWVVAPALEINPASTNVSATAATGRRIAVTANVAWTATANQPWIVVTGGDSGTNNGTTIFGTAANTGIAARAGTIVVAGGGVSRTCTVIQAERWTGAPWTLPGTVEMEDFNVGGAGTAYSDTTPGNAGGAYRVSEGVDVFADAGAGNGYVVGGTAAGEWLEYAVDVTSPGTYAVEARVADAEAGGQFRILFNGVDKTGLLAVPNTGSWYAYQTVRKTCVELSSGIQTVRVAMASAGSSGAVGNFDWFRVAAEFPRVQADASFGVVSNRFGFNIGWSEGQTVVVDACTNLANPVWRPLQTNVMAGGNFYFSHADWSNYPGRYYRLRSP